MNFARYGIINAKKYPNREFLIEHVFPGNERRVRTWKEFSEEANKLANYLQKECNIKPGDFVLHLQFNSLEWYTTFHGILRTGATPVPLNFRFFSQDIKFASDAVGATAMITEEKFLPRIQPIQGEMPTIKKYICIGQEVPSDMISYSSIIENGDTTDVLVDVDDEACAELMFTSGTTGKPKPVYQAHRNLYEIGIGSALSYNRGYNTIYLAPYALYHSGMFFLTQACYLAGGKIVLTNSLKPKDLLDVMVQDRVNDTHWMVPTMTDFLNAIKSGELDLSQYDLSFYGKVCEENAIGAQPVPPVMLEEIRKHTPFKTGNIYGITEGGGGGAFHCYDEDLDAHQGSIGKPTFNMEARIVDANGNDVPVGEVGELLLKGPKIMKEYYNNPELTAKTIVDGWLHTGDLARQDEDGFFYIADRAKDLIIRGGENIFPAEIEAAIHRSPKVDDVAIIGAPHPKYVEMAMAIIQLKKGESMTQEEVIEVCKQAGLAKYKWPEKVVFDEVMRNTTNKLDKPAMREKYLGKREVSVL
ncbi:MAG: class I adenylate-forming enzyme family protein [Desulfotomaculaceae bacterium]|nr:class I adenylate-forming enzyme family protein [Desulfotomaculaceae bacterium]